ncbi:zinc ribbon domain-containing protein [Paramesorhizobium deserti]|uniref:zinc ribbon domain-containing protein n=1 Tax=Paramesorhizobium deserti TaxID=1494590 RepID=UPI0009E9BA3E|nr:zinc ribbon domain-containing protein [Paramesorhizobium deserti]
MPFYDYECAECGVFTALRPMAKSAEPRDCPDCGQSARRVILRMPNIASMETGLRAAHAVNEQARHTPKSNRLSERSHGPGCSCCSTERSSRTTRRPDGSKSFVGARPWMISH